jgi:hypothetical protein
MAMAQKAAAIKTTKVRASDDSRFKGDGGT